jgi:L-aminopeptidase/D-esterase-like protein
MTARTGDVDLAPFGVAVGHATDDANATGLTVVRGVAGPLRAGVAVLGRATGTRELALLDPAHLVDRADAVLLAGGSAFGLDAAAGVMRWCEEQGRGFDVGVGVVPIVPAAVIFDLAPLGTPARPTPDMAYAACASARASGVAEGSVGAGAGATVGKALGAARATKGGVGLAVAGDPTTGPAVAALAVVNAFGEVRDAHGATIAGPRAPDGSFARTAEVLAAGAAAGRFGDAAGRNTTLAVVVASAPLSRLALHQMAHAAAAALHRRITPAGTSVDGDVVFAVAAHAERAHEPTLAERLAWEALAVKALEEAIERGVRTARGRDGVPGAGDG